MRLKSIVLVAAGIVVLAAAGLGVFLATFDVDRYRPEIAAAFKDATGRELTLGGPLKLAISLTPAVEARDVKIANAAWGSRPDMVRLARVAVTVELVPLLSGELRVSRATVEGLDVLLETSIRGEPNWVFGPAGTAKPGGAGAKPGAGRSLPVLGEVELSNSTVAYRDGASGTTHVVALKRVGAKARHLDAPLALTVDGAYGAAPFALDATIDSLTKLAGGDPVSFSLNANALDVALKVNGKLTGLTAKPEYEVQVAASADALTKVEGALGASLPLAGPIKFAAQVKGSPTRAVISGLDLKIGISDLGGTIAADLGGRRPAVAADLKAKKIDLASFQPTARSGAAKPAPAKAAAKDRVFSNDPIDVSVLNALDAKVGLAIDELVVRPGAAVRAVSLKLDLANGIAILKPLAATVAGSQLVGEATIDARKAVFDVAVAVKAPKVDLAQAMAFAGSPGLVESKGDVAIDLKTRGSSLAQLMGGLDGTIRAMAGEGRLKTTVIDDLVGGASAIIGTLVAGKRDATALTCAAVSFDVKKGVATAKALLIDTEFSTVAGEGSADLGNETLDLKVSPKPKGVTLNVAVPIKIKGTFAAPSIGPDELAAARKIGGLIGAFAFPPAALLGLGEVGGNDNQCLKLAAGDAKGSGAAAGAEGGAKPPASPVEKATDGVKGAVEGVGRGIRNLFGGSKQ
jgi:uncharacterized protein involved in outer membrane biogenesis